MEKKGWISVDFISMKKILEKSEEGFLERLGLETLKGDEVNTFVSFIDCVLTANTSSKKILYTSTDFFKYGFEIKQLGKEFDLLRVGKNYSINIELKTQSSEDKQFNQLERNDIYLKSLDQPIYYFSYSALENRLIGLDSLTNDKMMGESAIDFLLESLLEQDYIKDDSLYDEIFHPSNFLVSPFNQTRKFLDKAYLLSPKQQGIKKEFIESETTAISIVGGPGTGKSLLLYDLYSSVGKFDDKIVIHCGTLNEGHIKLKDEGFNIIPALDYKKVLDMPNLKFIFIDEAQRFYENQLLTILKFLEENNVVGIFSYDPKQIFEFSELGEINHNHIENFIESVGGLTRKLSNKIRSNNTILKSTDLIFKHSEVDYNTIENKDRIIQLQYFDSNRELLDQQLAQLKRDGYKILGFTPSKHFVDVYDEVVEFQEFKPHDVIGQEFQKVCVIINKGFRYTKKNNKYYELTRSGPSYLNGIKMLKMNISRTVNELRIIVMDNESVYIEIAKLFKKL